MCFVVHYSMGDTYTSSLNKKCRKEYKRQWMAASRSLISRKSSSVGKLSNDNIDVGQDDNHEEIACSSSYECCQQSVLPAHDEIAPIVHFPSNTCSTIDREQNEAFDSLDFRSNSDYMDSDSESDEEILKIEKDSVLSNDLAHWVNENFIEHNAVDSLLSVLKKHGHPSLPCTARTLLGTIKNVTTEQKSGMEYIYLGLEKQLQSYYFSLSLEQQYELSELSISFNIDGLPLFKSTNTSLWPILCKVHNQPVQIFPVALTVGTSKPSNLDFLSDTIGELDNLLQNGFLSGNRTIRINLKCIVCDAPAKAFVKGTKLYSGYYGCDKCAQKGYWIGRMTYQDVNTLSLRTNETFRSALNPEHHNHPSPFCDLPEEKLDMIKQFPLDYMHQVCLGVTKKLLLTWKRGKLEVRLSSQQIQEIGRHLVQLRSFVPEFFARKPRNLDEIDRWKATEFRQFLLYTGKIVLKDILRSDMYKNFMALSVGISILVSPILVQDHADYAHSLLEYFIESARVIYGPEFLVYNVHSLIHFTDEAKEHGNLDNCSAFAFENYLQKLKKMVRSGRNPMIQIVKRLNEQDNFNSTRKEEVFQGLKVLKFKQPNNAFVTENNQCCEIVSRTEDIDPNNPEIKMLLCRVYERPEPLFHAPCDSRIIGVYKAFPINCRMKLLSPNQLTSRAMLIDSDHNAPAVTFLTILHTI